MGGIINQHQSIGKDFMYCKNEEKNVVHKLCLPLDSSFPIDLYYRGSEKVKIVTNCDKDSSDKNTISLASLYIPKHEAVDFDTYFNMFPLFKWKNYTSICDLKIDVVIYGTAKVILYGIYKNNIKETPIIYDETLVSGKGEKCNILSFDNLNLLPDFLYLSFVTDEEEIIIEDFVFYTSASSKNEINIACCFCTYKREEDIKKNIENLLVGIIHKPSSNLYNNLHIFISDNGCTLPLDYYNDEPRIHLFHNKNYGGSAGFTRCIIESCIRSKGFEFTHIVLLDDDALIVPDVIERLGAFIGILKYDYEEYMLGGAMLVKEIPNVQKESGAFVEIENWKVTHSGQMVNMSDREELLAQEMQNESDINCNGWWCTCIPTKIINKKNLPLPLFIKLDDAEYGIRNHGRFIRLNGVCVWHPLPSGLAKLKADSSYYNARNSNILQAAYCPEKSALAMIKILVSKMATDVLNYRYSSFLFTIKGYLDFYNGIDSFKSTDAEKLNAELRSSMSYETCHLSKKEMDEYEIYSFQSLNNGLKGGFDTKSYKRRKLKKILNYVVPATKNKAIYNKDVPWNNIDLYQIKEIYLVDLQTGDGLVFRKSYKKLFYSVWEFFKTAFLILVKHRKIYKEWSESMSELKTYDFWVRYLDICELPTQINS